VLTTALSCPVAGDNGGCIPSPVLFPIVAFGGRLPAQTLRPVVYVVPINGVIDLGRAPSVGRVDAAVLIRDALLRARVRTVACVNERAMAEAFRQGNLGIMDYYRMKNVQADTDMQEAIAVGVARRPWSSRGLSSTGHH